jgi:hypothetical protein
MIMSRPRQPKDSANNGEAVCQMVVPSENRTSSCESFCCTACQYAKQKRKTPDSMSKTSVIELKGLLSEGSLSPGDKVSCDQEADYNTQRASNPH